MRVAVLGGDGFLGRSLVPALAVSRGVASIDRDDADLRDVGDVRRILREISSSVGLDAVVVLAAYTRGEDLDGEAIAPYADTVRIAASVAEVAREMSLRVVYVSTWEVYGDQPDVRVLTEDTVPLPTHPYAVTKYAAERLSLLVPDSIVLRLSTVYGPGLRGSAVMRRFAALARSGRRLTVNGVDQFRQFTHVDDVARAVGLAVGSTATGILNVASPDPTGIAALAERIAAWYGAEVSIGPPRRGDPKSIRIDATRAAEVLGWGARVALPVGLGECLAVWDAEAKAKAGVPS